MQHYGQVWFINFRAEAAELPTLVRPIDKSKSFRTSGCSPRTGKPVKGTLSTSVRDHMLVCNHKVMHEDFKFLANWN